jgi:transposase
LLPHSAQRTGSAASSAALPTDSLCTCPVCGGTMHVVERLSSAQLLLRSPPHPCRSAA